MKFKHIWIVIGTFILCILAIYSYEHFNGKSYNVVQTGGKIEDLTTYPIEGTPTINKNQSYLFLLEKTSEGHYLILGGYQGIGKINNNKLIFDKSSRISYSKLNNKNISEINQNLNNILNITN